MSEPRFKPGQFVSTSIGRMRVRKTKDFATYDKCIFGGNIRQRRCQYFRIKYPGYTCVGLIGWHCYLEEI